MNIEEIPWYMVVSRVSVTEGRGDEEGRKEGIWMRMSLWNIDGDRN